MFASRFPEETLFPAVFLHAVQIALCRSPVRRAGQVLLACKLSGILKGLLHMERKKRKAKYFRKRMKWFIHSYRTEGLGRCFYLACIAASMSPSSRAAGTVQTSLPSRHSSRSSWQGQHKPSTALLQQLGTVASILTQLRWLPLWRIFSALTALLGLLDTSVRCTKEQGRRLVFQDGSEVEGGTNTTETFRLQEGLCASEKSQKYFGQLLALSLLTYGAGYFKLWGNFCQLLR